MRLNLYHLSFASLIHKTFHQHPELYIGYKPEEQWTTFNDGDVEYCEPEIKILFEDKRGITTFDIKQDLKEEWNTALYEFFETIQYFCENIEEHGMRRISKDNCIDFMKTHLQFTDEVIFTAKSQHERALLQAKTETPPILTNNPAL